MSTERQGRNLGALFLGALGAIALLGGGAWWLLRGHDGAPEIVHVDRARATPSADPVPPEATGEAHPDARPERSTVAPPPSSKNEIDPRPPPESFVRELAGLRGRVVEEDGSPVPNKKIELLKIRPDLLTIAMEGGFAEPPPELVKLDVASDVTAEDGSFLLRDAEVVASLALLGVDLGGPRGTVRVLDVSFERGQVCDLGDVVLPPHVTFTGSVVDEDGAPVAGARVRVIPQLPVPIPMQAVDVGLQDIRSDCAAIGIAEQAIRFTVEMPPWLRAGFDRFPLPTTQTGSDGRFRLPGIPAGVVTLMVDRKEFLGVVRVGLPTGRKETQDVGTQHLSKGRRVTGRALAGEAPIAGARVLVGTKVALPFLGDEQASLALGQPAGRTDADGRFALDGLPLNGSVLCAIQPRPGDPWTVLGPFDQDDVKLELPPAATLTLLVVDGAGKPVEHAELRFTVDSPMNEIPILAPPSTLKERVTEQGEGRYVVTALSLGKWVVLARAAGFGICQQTVELPAEGATATLQLPAARAQTVKVVDAMSGEPVDYALVTALRDLQNFFPMPLKAARTSREGKATLEQLPVDASLKIRVTHPGFALGSADVPKEGGVPELAIALLRGGDLVGRVTQGGEPPAKRLMLILDPRGGGKLPEEELPRFAVTDADGSFRVRHLRAGEWNWNVFSRFLANDPVRLLPMVQSEPDELAKGQCQIEEGKETRLDIEALPEGALAAAVVRGRVRVDGEVVAGLEVRLMGRRHLNVELDAQGRFEFPAVKPGDYTLEVAQEKGDARTSLYQEPLSIAPGATKDLEIDVRTIPTTIIVRTKDGAPAGGTRVTLSDANSGRGPTNRVRQSNGSTDAQGKVTIPLQPGQWQIRARHEELGLATSTFELTDRGVEPIELTLVAGHRVEGTITFDDPPEPPGEGETWGAMLVTAAKSEGDEIVFGDNQWISIDPADRRFAYKGVASGRYRLNVWMRRQGQLVSEEFEVGQGDVLDLALRMKKVGK